VPSLDALLALLVTIAVTALVAPRLRVPLPIALTAAGLVLALVLGKTSPRLPPELVLLVLLPPLLYADAFNTSWHDFRRWLRPIMMLAVGLVAFTILTVGLAAHWLFPELPLVVCFALGAILSPTDTVATHAVLQRLRIPRRATAILGGESLVNDGTGLVGVQICVVLLATGITQPGELNPGTILLRFAWIVGGGTAIGLLVGAVFAALNRHVRETSALFVLSLVSPYLAALLALELEASAVLAVVVAGFFVAWRIHNVPAPSRTALYTVWEQLVFLLNALSFLYIGLEVPALLKTSETLGRQAVTGALVIALVVMATRVAWTFPAAYLWLWLSPRLRAREGGYPRFRNVVVAAWCGVRGSVSLAAALALPETVAGGQLFPGRELVVFVTLVVVLVTLFAQGLTLGPLVRALRIQASPDGDTDLRTSREAVLRAGIARLDEYCNEIACPLSIHHLRAAMEDELAALQEQDEAARTSARQRLDVSRDVRAAVHAAQSRALLDLRDSERINDLVLMRVQLELDGISAPNEA